MSASAYSLSPPASPIYTAAQAVVLANALAWSAKSRQSADNVQAQPLPHTTDAYGAKPKRTSGMWLFDTLLYPILTNAAVFAISVFATYQTTHGKPGNWLRQRGDFCRGLLEKSLGKGGAEMAVMITFSFLDGCLMAPVVKMFEDRRGPISRWLDRQMGTTPADPSVYDREPKQTWASVLGGRAATSMVVVPTAVALHQKWGGKTSLNERLFSIPGFKMGQWLEAKVPQLQRTFPRLYLPGLCKIGVFEAFYTSVCTAGLYLTSRLFASLAEPTRQSTNASASSPIANPGIPTNAYLPGNALTNPFGAAVRWNPSLPATAFQALARASESATPRANQAFAPVMTRGSNAFVLQTPSVAAAW
ncbi:MAG: hypothetical protein SFZ03_04520 [Candidatus Melainabacteria bacterium]|nr:hypothetical protein [Candidatus Melainabacteria bacterium]